MTFQENTAAVGSQVMPERIIVRSDKVIPRMSQGCWELHLKSTAGMIGLNEAAGKIWELCNGSHTVSEIADALISIGLSASHRSTVFTFIAKLLAMGYLEQSQATPSGSKRLSGFTFSAGGVRCCVTSNEPAILEVLLAKMPFNSSSAIQHHTSVMECNDADLHVELKLVPVVDKEWFYEQAKEAPPGRIFGIGDLGNMAGYFDVESNIACLHIRRDEGWSEMFDHFIRLCFSWFAASHGALLLHASAVAWTMYSVPCQEENRPFDELGAYAFAGPQGAGKSTIAMQCRTLGLSVLNEDVILLKPEGNQVIAHSLPFRGGGTGIVDVAPLRAIFFLTHGKQPRLNTLSYSDKILRLAHNLQLIGERSTTAQALLRKIFPTLHKIIEHVPCYELQLTPETTAWRFVTNMLKESSRKVL